MTRKTMEEIFNIPADGFVENPWGFPPVPRPKRRSTSATGQIIAPDTISFDGLGHPIFWIDPELTKRTESEHNHPEQWNIRMFYLIMAFDMYDPQTLNWYNVPRTQGVDYTEDDWLAYQQGTSSALDAVTPLTESNLIEPLALVEEQAAYALERCAESQAKVWSKYRAEVESAYATAVATTQGRSEWDELDQRMKETSAQIADALSKNVIPSTKVPEVYAQIDELEQIITHTEHCALLLSLPVLNTRSHGDRAAAAMTAMNAAKADVAVDVDSLRSEAHRLFELSSQSKPREFVRLYESSVAAYMESWRSMMVAARNLVRTSEGQSIHQSWEAFSLVEDPHKATWPPLSQVLSGVGK
jgi:hypothetical protein